MVIFEINKQLSPETYRQQTRRSTLIVAVTFAVLAMGLAALRSQCSARRTGITSFGMPWASLPGCC